MKTNILRIIMISSALSAGGIGVYLLHPFYEGTASYSHPKLSFYMSILFIAWGGYYLAQATTGFEHFKESKAGKRILGK